MKNLLITLLLTGSSTAFATKLCQHEAVKAAIAVDEINSSYQIKTLKSINQINKEVITSSTGVKTTHVTYKIVLINGEFDSQYHVAISGEPAKPLSCQVNAVILND
jgi:hypothetical protein